MHPNLFWGQKWFFREGPRPIHHTPSLSTPAAHLPLLTEILNTLLGYHAIGQVAMSYFWMRRCCLYVSRWSCEIAYANSSRKIPLSALTTRSTFYSTSCNIFRYVRRPPCWRRLFGGYDHVKGQPLITSMRNFCKGQKSSPFSLSSVPLFFLPRPSFSFLHLPSLLLTSFLRRR